MMGYTKEEMEEKIPEILAFADIGDFVHQPVKTYSSGMFVRLAFALAINVEPEILIVDEVLAVGDKIFRKKSRDKIIEMFNQGKSVLFSSHADNLIEEFCSRVIYLRDGRIVYDGEVKEGLRLYNEDAGNRKK